MTLLLGGQPGLAAGLTAAVHRTWEESPQLKAQAEQIELSRGDERRRFWPNEPQLQLARNDNGVAHQAGLTLSVGLPGKAAALQTLDAAKVVAQEQELKAKRYDLAKTTVQAYLDCAQQQALVVLAKTSAGDLATLSDLLHRLYDSGHSSQADTIGAQLQLRQAEADQLTAQDKAAVACERLSKLPGLAGFAAPDLPDDLDAALTAELQNVAADQARATAVLQVANATATVASWQQLPDLSFGVTRNHYTLPTASPAGSSWTTNVSLGVTLPLFYRIYEGSEERRQRSQAAIDADNAHLQLIASAADRSDASREYRRSQARLQSIRQRDLVLADALVDGMLSGYRSGKVGFAELVFARKTLNDLRAQEIQLRSSIVLAHLRCLSQC